MSARGPAGAAAVAGLAAALQVLAFAGPAAAADGSFSAPEEGRVVAAYATVEPRASVSYGVLEARNPVALKVFDPVAVAGRPGGCTWQLDSKSPAAPDRTVDLAGAVDLARYPEGITGCALGGRPARNGTWQFTLDGAATQTRSITVRVPPGTPTGVRAVPGSGQGAVVTWAANPEADTHAYDVVESGTRVAGGESRDLCDASGCRIVVAYPGGGSHSLAVRAVRRSAPDAVATSDLTGPPSAPQSVEVPRPAGNSSPGATATTGPGEPAPGSTGSGSTGSGSTGSGSTGSGGTGSGGTGPTGTATAATPSPGGPAAPAARGQRGGPSSSAAGVPGIGGPGDAGQQDRLRKLFDGISLPTAGEPPPLPSPGPEGPALAAPPPAGQAAETPAPDGPFSRTLGYGPQTQTTTELRVRAQGPPLAGVADSLGLSPVAFWRSLACSALLLLAGSHLRRWSRSAPLE